MADALEEDYAVRITSLVTNGDYDYPHCLRVEYSKPDPDEDLSVTITHDGLAIANNPRAAPNANGVLYFLITYTYDPLGTTDTPVTATLHTTGTPADVKDADTKEHLNFLTYLSTAPQCPP